MLKVLNEQFHSIAVVEPLSHANLAEIPLHCVVTSPLGDEFVVLDECEHPTRTMDLNEIKRLLVESNPHRHATVSSMQAVKLADTSDQAA